MGSGERPAEGVTQLIGAVALLVPSYEEGLAFYAGTLGFDVIENVEMAPGKRWVLVAPSGSSEMRLLLARADTEEQKRSIGKQAGGRVFLFLHTDDFWRDHKRYLAAGVTFLEAPREESYGTVAVFRDPFGNKWDLIERRNPDRS
jgi:catechol 2,3-dioxygenase-like lactoylglutathione lyase family enzyme